MWGWDGPVGAGVESSPFGRLPEGARRRVLERARVERVPARTLTHRVGERDPHLELVLDGVMRVYVTGPNGRSMTVRYCRTGALIGVMSLYARDYRMPAYVQALTETTLLHLAPGVVRQAARDDGQVAELLLCEVADRTHRLMHDLPGSVFATVRQRVARHLLDLASEVDVADRGPAGRLTVEASQSDLAEAAGSVREVVVRVLAELRESGVISTYRDHIDIVDPVRLSRAQAGT